MINGDPYKEKGMSDLDYSQLDNPGLEEEDYQQVVLEDFVDALVELTAAELVLGEDNASAWMAGIMDDEEDAPKTRRKVSLARRQAIDKLLPQWEGRPVGRELLNLKNSLDAPAANRAQAKTVCTTISEDVTSDGVPF